MSAVTQWFVGVKPEHVGVYEVGTRQAIDPTVICGNAYQHWNGEFWSTTCTTPEAAERHAGIRSVFQDEPWRGLVDVADSKGLTPWFGPEDDAKPKWGGVYQVGIGDGYCADRPRFAYWNSEDGYWGSPQESKFQAGQYPHRQAAAAIQHRCWRGLAGEAA